MDFKTLVEQTRSIRRFDESEMISEESMRELIYFASLAPSGANLQPLRYFFSNEASLNAQIFPALGWAGYLKDWSGPSKGERPAGYIAILNDSSIKKETIDHGFAAQNIVLGAREKGLGACVIKSIDQEALSDVMNIPENLDILLVIAIGKPAERVKIEPVKNNDIRYWRDNQQVFHVPKRSLDEILIK